MKKNVRWLAGIFIVLVCVSGWIIFKRTSDTQTDRINSFYGNISSGIVPHHLEAKGLIENFFRQMASARGVKKIVILGPDHFNVTSVTGSKFLTNTPNIKLPGMELHAQAVKDDHAISDLMPYIKRAFPDSEIIPILISGLATKEDMLNLINELDRANTIVIASVDFSHYLPPEAADFHDIKSIQVVKDFKQNEFSDIDVDSWQALFGARWFAKIKGWENPQEIGRSKITDPKTNGTTSHYSVIFRKGYTKEKSDAKTTLLFTGDIMLDGDIERLTLANGSTYPFRKIVNVLKGVDIVVGNLEGALVSDPVQYNREALIFHFAPEMGETLKWANFELLSLANNHSQGGRKQDLEETKILLKRNGIDWVGDPISCADEAIKQQGEVVIVAVNTTFPVNCDKENLAHIIRTAKSRYPGEFLIVEIHWGNEYQTTNSANQAKLGHALIDAGADVIIGMHPHVTQNIEVYKNKPIFYSLGNFVFDQYFSLDTQQGIMVGIELDAESVAYRIFPINISWGQPELMDEKQKRQFLTELANRSDKDLWQVILNGILYLRRN